MPRLSNEQINARVRDAMQPQTQPVAGKLSPTTMDSIIQKAKQKRGAKVEPKMLPKARGY